MKTTPVCAYCGKLWPKHKGGTKDIPSDIAEDVRNHVQECPQNPLVKKIAELKDVINSINNSDFSGRTTLSAYMRRIVKRTLKTED